MRYLIVKEDIIQSKKIDMTIFHYVPVLWLFFIAVISFVIVVAYRKHNHQKKYSFKPIRIYSSEKQTTNSLEELRRQIIVHHVFLYIVIFALLFIACLIYNCDKTEDNPLKVIGYLVFCALVVCCILINLTTQIAFSTYYEALHFNCRKSFSLLLNDVSKYCELIGLTDRNRTIMLQDMYPNETIDLEYEYSSDVYSSFPVLIAKDDIIEYYTLNYITISNEIYDKFNQDKHDKRSKQKRDFYYLLEN